ncbi:MAG: sigma-54-dependent Fis family transcriptional regulator [Deltaproteobacteria bacterium]|nr:sigma-54-dependent Fis family transcriptional regulator [Deltaproteobacteria bacterium]
MGKAVLVIDADSWWREVCQPLERTLSLQIYQVSTAAAVQELLPRQFFHLVFLAETLAGQQTAAILGEIKREQAFLPVFVCSTSPSVEGAVASMRGGAQDYLSAPLTLEKLRDLIVAHLLRTPEAARLQQSDNGRVRPIITQDAAMFQVLRTAEAVAPTRATVLIQGESGTGKEILARYLHQKSDRSSGPFVAVNCAALPEGLLESELFGHEKGAFTGAIMRKLGKFELAQQGTLLLDEISEMHSHLQAKLLRVLQENEIDRVGGRQPIPINVRVVATTNQNLADLIQKGHFREDLYYRLQVISLQLPPLRNRRGDIPLLAEFFVKRYAQLFSKTNLRFTAAALKTLENAPWPGNVRHLENAVARGVLLAQGNSIHPQDLLGDAARGAVPAQVQAPSGQPVTLREMEQRLIFQTLHETDGNRTHAAKLLGISVRTLRNKLHEYRLGTCNSARQGARVA